MNEVDRVINYIRFCRENNIDAVIAIDRDKSHVVLNALELSKKYADTGLTPEQIKEIDKLYTEQAKELAELKENSIKLPCKIGKTVYEVSTYLFEQKEECQNCEYYYEGDNMFVGYPTCYHINGGKPECYMISEHKATLKEILRWMEASYGFGKTIFLTREEAEAKLKEMENE